MKIGEMYNAEMLAKICRAGEIKLEELIKDCNAVTFSSDLRQLETAGCISISDDGVIKYIGDFPR